MTKDRDDDPAGFLRPSVDEVASTGAAAETAEWEEKLKVLPRILRYAVMAKGNHPLKKRRGSLLDFYW